MRPHDVPNDGTTCYNNIAIDGVVDDTADGAAQHYIIMMKATSLAVLREFIITEEGHLPEQRLDQLKSVGIMNI